MHTPPPSPFSLQTSGPVSLRQSLLFSCLVSGSEGYTGELHSCLFFFRPSHLKKPRHTHTPQSYPPSCCTSSLHTHMLPVVVLVWPSPPVCSLLAMNRSDWLPVSLSSLPVCTGMNGHIIHSDAVPPLTPILTLYTAFCSFSFSLCLFHSSEDNSMSSQWYNSKPLPPPPSALPPLPHHSVLQYQPLEQQSPGLTA